MGRVVRAVVAALVVALPAIAAEWAYTDGDVRAVSPGPEWTLQTSVEGAPNVRAAWSKPRGPERASILNFVIDGTPEVTSPVEYAKRTLSTLGGPPFGFKVKKAGAFTWKGNAAARAEYTDAAGKRFWAQATIYTPHGGMLVVTMQSPDAESYGQDMKVFSAFLEGLAVAPPDPPKQGTSP
jgi:hypothetical protein